MRYAEVPLAVQTSRVVSVDALRGFNIFWILGADGAIWVLDRMLHDKGPELSSFGNFLKTQMSHAAWEGFRFYDFIHWFAKKSFSIQIFKRSLFPPLKFNEGITMNEDLDLLNEALAYGSFFYVPTTCVHASTRRFDKEGYWRLLFEWTVIANLPKWTQPKFTYKVIR